MHISGYCESPTRVPAEADRGQHQYVCEEGRTKLSGGPQDHEGARSVKLFLHHSFSLSLLRKLHLMKNDIISDE